MTFRDLVQIVNHHPWLVVGFLAAVPLLAVLFGLFHKKSEGGLSPWKYMYSVLIYVSCFTGVFAILLTCYTLFFTDESLLDASLNVYFLPILSMIGTLLLIRRNVTFDEIPGFDQLSGFLVLIGVTFGILLAVQKTRIWLLFGSSFFTLLVVIAVLFLVLKWSTDLIFRRTPQQRERE